MEDLLKQYLALIDQYRILINQYQSAVTAGTVKPMDGNPPPIPPPPFPPHPNKV
jgi:hypothetical protein